MCGDSKRHVKGNVGISSRTKSRKGGSRQKKEDRLDFENPKSAVDVGDPNEEAKVVGWMGPCSQEKVQLWRQSHRTEEGLQINRSNSMRTGCTHREQRKRRTRSGRSYMEPARPKGKRQF